MLILANPFSNKVVLFLNWVYISCQRKQTYCRVIWPYFHSTNLRRCYM